jgi:hypothetical protein
MTTLALTLTLLLNPPPTVLHCRVEVAPGAEGRCRVDLPLGRQVRACADADRRAGHCDLAAGGGQYVAWTVGTGQGKCRISKKKTVWERTVTAKLSKSRGTGSTCDLYVEFQ